jgi:ATP-binding cassette subfamily G (WHITE) protein 2 (PDR)
MATNIVGSGVNGIFQSSNREEQELGAGNPNTAYTSAPTRNQHPEQSYQQDVEGTIDPEKPNADYYSSQHPAHRRSHSLTEKDSTPSSSDTPKVGEDDTVRDDRLDRQVTDLARRFSKQSEQTDSSSKNPFEAEGDPELDVNSPSFKPRSWIKSLLHLSSRDPEHHQMRTAGFAFKNLNVHGFGTATDYQKTLGNLWLGIPGMITSMLGLTKKRRIDILTHLDGVVYPGELLVVLGPPGSGCSTFLKTVSGETHGFFVDESSEINYQGISPKMMNKDFRGENIYTAEVDVHFPNMTVGQTLSFAAQARAPRHIPGGIPRKVYADYLRDATMAVFGISHTLNTKVGNDFVRGVSGGERKRVTIAEASLAGAPLQCWDNSTRGLDSANAVEFCKTLRMSAELIGTTAAVAIYQAPQSAYDVFDKVLVLYEGRQIFFGRTTEAKPFFEEMGFWCPDRQTDADFLTSMTSPQERVVRSGFENKVPRTPDDFAAAWKASQAYGTLQTEIAEFNQAYPIGGAALEKFKASRKAQQARGQRLKSPFTLSYTQQIKLCLDRGFQRLLSDPSLTITQIIANTIMV